MTATLVSLDAYTILPRRFAATRPVSASAIKRLAMRRLDTEKVEQGKTTRDLPLHHGGLDGAG